jgi:hypothetical protein
MSLPPSPACPGALLYEHTGQIVEGEYRRDGPCPLRNPVALSLTVQLVKFLPAAVVCGVPACRARMPATARVLNRPCAASRRLGRVGLDSGPLAPEPACGRTPATDRPAAAVLSPGTRHGV